MKLSLLEVLLDFVQVPQEEGRDVERYRCGSGVTVVQYLFLPSVGHETSVMTVTPAIFLSRMKVEIAYCLSQNSSV